MIENVARFGTFATHGEIQVKTADIGVPREHRARVLATVSKMNRVTAKIDASGVLDATYDLIGVPQFQRATRVEQAYESILNIVNHRATNAPGPRSKVNQIS